MPLGGFPDDIDVVLGTKWSGRNGLSNSTALTLSKVSGQDKWSEDGTTTYNSSTNRLMLFFTSPGYTGNVDFYVGNFGTNQTTFSKIFRITLYLSEGSGAVYTFLDIWNAGFPNLSSRSQGMYGSPDSEYAFTGDASGYQYSSDIFSTMEAGAGGGGGGGLFMAGSGGNMDGLGGGGPFFKDPLAG